MSRTGQRSTLRPAGFLAQTVNGVFVKGDWAAKARFAHAARLHEALKLDMNAWFTPTAANYFGKISKTAILEVLRETNGGDASEMTIKEIGPGDPG